MEIRHFQNPENFSKENWYKEELAEIFWVHLKETKYKIMCGIINTWNTLNYTKWDFIDYFWEWDKNKYQYLKWKEWYASISNRNSNDKYSLYFKNCTSCVVIWKDKKAWKNVSILTHQDPNYFLKDGKEIFSSKLKESFIKIKEQCEEWTIDIVLLWGNNRDIWTGYGKEYKESIIFLSNIIHNIFWFYPVLIWWTDVENKRYSWDKHIFLDTQKRQIIYIKWYKNYDEYNFVSTIKDFKNTKAYKINNYYTGIYKKSIEDLEKYAKEFSFNAYIYEILIEKLIHNKNYDKAENYIKKALKKFEDNYIFYKYLVDIFNITEQTEKLIQTCNQAIKNLKENTLFYTTLIKTYKKTNQIENAIQICNQAIEKIEYNTIFYNYLIEIYESIWKYQKAIDVCNQAIKNRKWITFLEKRSKLMDFWD